MENSRWQAAEEYFLQILAADPSDWEAREALVRVYQSLGLKEKRDVELSVLRRMHSSGKAWRQFILRDEFDMAGKRVQAIECPSLEFPDRRRILFGFRDSAGGDFRFLASVNRMERKVIPSFINQVVKSGRSVPGYRLVFLTERQRREYFLPYQKPGYSTMKKMIINYLVGL